MARYSMTRSEVEKLQKAVEQKDNRLARARKAAEKQAGRVVHVVETAGGAAAVGFIRGKMQEADGSWNIPGTTIDLELAIGLGLVGSSFIELFGKYDDDVLAVGSGIMAHYMGQVFRKYGSTGAFSLVAGNGNPLMNALNSSGV